MSEMQPNTVTIIDNTGLLSGVTYVPQSVNVTPGEPYEETPTINHSAKQYIITLQAGREGSSSVADAFNASSGGKNNEYAPFGGGGTPNKLNFFFSVNLTFSTSSGTVSYVVNLGQGHKNTTNNWWIGGGIVNSSVEPAILQFAINNTPFVLPMSGDSDSFIINNS